MGGLLNPLRTRIGGLLPPVIRSPLGRLGRGLGLLTVPAAAEPTVVEVVAPTAPKIALRNIMIGTTNVCNASCIHCPTNKVETDHVPRGVMPMEAFKSLIDQLANESTIEGFIGIGVHGDGLVDPLILERARYVHEKMPEVVLHVNTNGAAYAPAKHKALKEVIHVLALHTESLKPDVYNDLLRPLRLERVGPKMDMILEDFGAKTFVSVPVSRANHAELDEIEDHFLSRGAAGVLFGPLTNRCSKDKETFARLAFDPLPGSCPGSVAQDLIIDWDGVVMVCCNDFARELPIGDFSKQTLKEVVNSPERAKVAELLDAGRWSELATCSRCEFDCWQERPTRTAKTEPVAA
jgi:radical SAM protein with 4Fe4S-binding SPASM domain